MDRPIARILDLVDPASQRLRNRSLDEARRVLLADDAAGVLSLEGSFALVAQEGERVCLARSLDRPLRYFLAKDASGPALVVAERIDEIQRALEAEGWGGQFHPTYTRMVPAHHVTTLRLIGCPDPNPVYRRFFDPPRGVLPPDLARIGEAYVGALYQEVRRWLGEQDAREPIGVAFSGGLDSGAVLLCLYRALLDSGQSPARLRAFTLAVGRRGQGRRAGARVPAPPGPRGLRGADRDRPGRGERVGGGGGHRGLQAPRRAVRGGRPGPGPGHPRAPSRLAAPGGRRRGRREPQGLSDRGERGADHPERGEQPHAVPGGMGVRVSQALPRLQRRLQPSLRPHLRQPAAPRLRGLQPVHVPHGRGRGRSRSLRPPGGGPDGTSLRAQGRDPEPGREVGARPRHAGVCQAALPARRRGARGRGPSLRRQRRGLSEPASSPQYGA